MRIVKSELAKIVNLIGKILWTENLDKSSSSNSESPVNDSPKRLNTYIPDSSSLYILMKYNDIVKTGGLFSDFAKRDAALREKMAKSKCFLMTDTTNAGLTSLFLLAFGRFRVSVTV